MTSASRWLPARCWGSSASRAAARRRPRWRARFRPAGRAIAGGARLHRRSATSSPLRDGALRECAGAWRHTSHRSPHRPSTHRSAWATGWARCCARTSPSRPTCAETAEVFERVGLPSTTGVPAALRASALRRAGAARRDRHRVRRAGRRSSILDEPTTGLDVITQATILEEIARLQRASGVAMVYVSHDLSVVGRSPTGSRSCTPGESSRRRPPQRCWRDPRHPVLARPDRVGARPRPAAPDRRDARRGRRRRQPNAPAAASRPAAPSASTAARPRCPRCSRPGPRTPCAASSGPARHRRRSSRHPSWHRAA